MKDDKGGCSKDCYDWMSLRGHDRQVLFKKFPELIPSILPGKFGQDLKDLWEVYPTLSISALMYLFVYIEFPGNL